MRTATAEKLNFYHTKTIASDITLEFFFIFKGEATKTSFVIYIAEEKKNCLMARVHCLILHLLLFVRCFEKVVSVQFLSIWPIPQRNFSGVARIDRL